MRPILAMASALAIILSAAACSGASDPNELAAYDTARDGHETRTDGGDMASAYNRNDTVRTGTAPGDDQTVVTTGADIMKTRQAFLLGTDEVKASKLIGADVMNTAGEGFANVSDVWMG